MLVEGPKKEVGRWDNKGLHCRHSNFWFQERIYKANGVSIEFTKVETVQGSSSYPCATFKKS